MVVDLFAIILIDIWSNWVVFGLGKRTSCTAFKLDFRDLSPNTQF